MESEGTPKLAPGAAPVIGSPPNTTDGVSSTRDERGQPHGSDRQDHGPQQVPNANDGNGNHEPTRDNTNTSNAAAQPNAANDASTNGATPHANRSHGTQQAQSVREIHTETAKDEAPW